ncbi:hypothetical protein BWQ96_01252 [Gracilariopsis chorda]|uniref:Uncharacterized protein n=1 Tax=Gracilariopsis chorda TaxID=448386 RepID=A0A2V3J6A2_9FLOR|nr:hypothetical protein BWQ96_01252 [Gracilariopsis chorda]|eukprot:PXF48910.1 hypothetical protein BWQ96_01252 [Gracilariopsis chorda]
MKRASRRPSVSVILRRLPVFLLAFVFFPFLVRVRIRHARSAPVYFDFERVTVNSVASGKPNPEVYKQHMNQLLRAITSDYIDWHRQQLHICEENATHAQTIPKLVYRSMRRNYGVGDVIRGLLHSYLIAVISKRMFFIDVERPFPLSMVLTSPNGYNFTYDRYLFPELSSYEHIQWLRKSIYFDKLDTALSDTPTLVDESQTVLDWELFLIIPRLYPQLEISKKLPQSSGFSPTREEVIPFILKALFCPSPELRSLLPGQENTDNLVWPLSTLFSPDQNLLWRNEMPAYISVHARVGYGFNETEARFNLKNQGLTPESLATCMAQMAVRMADQRRMLHPHHFFISSDTDHFRTLFKTEVNRLRPSAKVYQSNWQAVHMNRVGRSQSPSKVSDFMNTYVDVYLLSKGKSMLFIRSGFSHVALWMGAITDFVGIRLKYCTRVMNGSSSLEKSMNDAEQERAGYQTERYRSINSSAGVA